MKCFATTHKRCVIRPVIMDNYANWKAEFFRCFYYSDAQGLHLDAPAPVRTALTLMDGIVAGEGVERKFPVHSPRIERVEVKRSSVIRRAKLYFLRDRVGKAVRLKERRRT